MWAIVTDAYPSMGYLKREPFGTRYMELFYWNNKESNKVSKTLLQLWENAE